MDNADIINERQAYRINGEIEFAYYIIPDDKTSTMIDETVLNEQLFDAHGAQHFKLMQQFQVLDASVEQLKQNIAHDYPQLTDYFQYLDRKFEMMASVLLQSDTRPLQKVNLSIGGIGFLADEKINPGTALKAKLILLPYHRGIIATVNVVHCTNNHEDAAAQPYRISAKFVNLNEMEEKLVMAHIMHTQLEELKQESDSNR